MNDTEELLSLLSSNLIKTNYIFKNKIKEIKKLVKQNQKDIELVNKSIDQIWEKIKKPR